MDLPKFSRLIITGDISVRLVTSTAPQNTMSYTCVLMGSTGVGKSSFIERFAGKNQKLSISKDQLTSCTQEVTAYQVVNVTYQGRPICLIDTPGFCDTKLSEMEIMNKVHKWLTENGISSIASIFFFTPINSTRLPGTKRRTIEMLKTILSRRNSLCSVVFVTTMWDTLNSKRAQGRGESNFAELKFDIFKSTEASPEIDIITIQQFLDEYASITRFTNTRSSALQVLDQVTYSSKALTTSLGTVPQFYQDLHERIENALQRKLMLESELALPMNQIDSELKMILENDYKENEATLSKFVLQFVQLGEPPAQVQETHRHLQAIVDPQHRIRLFNDFSAHEAIQTHEERDQLNLDLMEDLARASDVPRTLNPDLPPNSDDKKFGSSWKGLRWYLRSVVQRMRAKFRTKSAR